MIKDERTSTINLRMFLGLYVGLFFVAPIFFYFGLSTSLMLGTIGVLGIWFLLHIVVSMNEKFIFNLRITNSFLFISIFFVLHFVAAYFYFQYNASLSRGFFSLILLLFFLFCAFQFTKYFTKISNDHIDFSMKISFIVFLVILILSFIKPIQPLPYSKSIFPFTESSHYALYFVGCLYYTAVRYKNYRILILLFALVAALLLKNLTLLVAVIVLAFCLFKFWMVLVGVVISVLMYNFLDLSYFKDRVENISSDSSNLSTLVFVQGWELAIDALKKSSGLGIGLQQLGEIRLTSRASRIIYALTRAEYNITDAGLTAPKLICEFGVFAIGALSIFLVTLTKGILYMRKFVPGKFANNKLLAYCFIVSFFTELFVRGVGYFVGTFFLVITSLIYLYFYKDYSEKNIE